MSMKSMLLFCKCVTGVRSMFMAALASPVQLLISACFSVNTPSNSNQPWAEVTWPQEVMTWFNCNTDGSSGGF